MVQLKGNLTPTRGQQVQHPRVLLVPLIMSMQVPLGDFSCVEQSLPVTSVGVLKIPTHVVYYRAYYTWVNRDEKPMLLLNGNSMGLVAVITTSDSTRDY